MIQPNIPDFPTMPDWSHILSLWDYSNEAAEITQFFQQLFSRLPPYFLSFYALSFFFIIVPIIIGLVKEIK